jgi:capsid protein
MSRVGQPLSISQSLQNERCDYEAAKRGGRFQRRRRGVPVMGAGADYHYRSESDYLWMGEVARDMYRNDPILGQVTDRAVINWIGSGLTPDPNTGDRKVDKYLKDKWADECEEPDLCDVAGELTFHEQEIMVGREILVPGDCFGAFMPNGTTQLIESHRCRKPSRTTKNIVHGIELDKDTREKLRGWFSKEPIDPLANGIKVSDLRPIDFRDREGERQLMHIYSPKRITQTRGVTAYAPIIVTAGMFGDLNFAHLLKCQLNAMWMLVRKREKGFFEDNPMLAQLGITRDMLDSVGGRRTEALAPGAELVSNPGETITPWNANNPPAEFFPHARLIMTLIGINLGMPLVLLLMDASETNFSGYRGAVDQARLGFRHNQRILKARFHRPTWRFKVNYWADHDPYLRAARERLGKTYFRHRWHTPGWPYIEPMKDAQTDLLRAANMQSSPRRLAMERGNEWEEIYTETIEDRGNAIKKACAAAKKLNDSFKLAGTDIVSWRDLAPLPTPQGVTVQIKGTEDTGEQPNAKSAKSAA